MSGVSALTTTTGNSMTGSINLVSTQTSLLNVSNNPTAPFTINFSPVFGGVNSVGGKNGNVSLTTPDGCLSITPDAISPQLKFNAYNAGSNTSGMVANNVSGSLAWVSSNAYAVGAVVIDSGTTYMCLTAQPASSPAPSNGANWQSIGGGGGGSSISAVGSTVSCDATTGTISVNASASTGSQPDVLIQSAGASTGVKIETNTTSATFDDYTDNAVPGQIQLVSTDGTNPATVSIGGASNNTGLYVSNSQLLFNGNAVGTGGNWSYKGAFNTTVATTYAINDVVFDSVNTAETYVCIVGYTTTVPSPTAPSADPTNWQLFATSAPTQIAQAGASVAVGTGGGIISTTTGGDDYIVNTKTGTATGNIILSGNGTNTFGSANINIMNNSASTFSLDTSNGGSATLNAPGKISLLTSATGNIVAGSDTASFGTGDVLFNASTWNDQGGYIPGSVVQETAGGASYLCITAVSPNTTSPYNPAPSATPADWLPLGGGGGTGNMTYTPSVFTWAGTNSYVIGDIVSDTNNGVYVATLANSNAQPQSNVSDWQLIGSTSLSTGGGITGIEINGGTAYPTAGNIINFQPGSGIVMSNTGSNIINISASPQGSGAYLTNNSNTWEWLSTNSYSATEGVVSYQGGLYANILAPSSNVPPFGASNSTTLWAGLAPSLSIGTSNISPLQPSASNAYTYSFVQGSNSNVSITSPATGQIALDATIGFDYPGSTTPIVGSSGIFTFQSSASNITITSPGAGLIDLNVDAPAMNYSSVWTATGVYQIDDVVIYGEGSWVCLVATTAGESPDSTPASWRLLGTINTNLEASVLPADMVSGVIPNECLVANTAPAYSAWNSSNAYRVGNVVKENTGALYTSLTNNSNSQPLANPGSNSDWLLTGFTPVASSLVLQSGSNVAGLSGGSLPVPFEFLTFSNPTTQLSSATFGGCVATLTAEATMTFGTWSNAGNIITAQLFDSGTSNTQSFSAPYKFPTPVPYSTSNVATIPPFSASITTSNWGYTSPVQYSLVFGVDTIGTGTVSSSSITGIFAYQFSGTGSNLTFV